MARWPSLNRRGFSKWSLAALGGWWLEPKMGGQELKTASAPASGQDVSQGGNVKDQASACIADSEPINAWASTAALQIRVFPDGQKDPLAGPGIVYGRAGNVDLKLDVFTAGPETVSRPTVIYFHGGGWVCLRKEERAFYVLPYLARGMNAVNVEYRLASAARAPAAVEDVRRALHWVYGHAQEYGFDTQRLVVIGESAGGHLALMAGMLNSEDGFDDAFAWSQRQTPVKAAAIINYFGPTDLVGYLQERNVPPFLIEWLGPTAGRMALAKQLSPLTYVRKGTPPIITIHGSKDGGVPYSQAVRLHEALAAANIPNQLLTIQGGAHGQRSWTCEDNLRAQQTIFKFLEEHGVINARG